MFYSSADNGGAEAIPRGEEVVRATPARVKDLWGYVVLTGEVLVLLKGIASLTGVKSTSPSRSSPLAIDRYFVVFSPRLCPSFLPFFLLPFCSPLFLSTSVYASFSFSSPPPYILFRHFLSQRLPDAPHKVLLPAGRTIARLATFQTISPPSSRNLRRNTRNW